MAREELLKGLTEEQIERIKKIEEEIDEEDE